MERLEYLEIVGDRGEFRIAGEFALEVAGALVTRSIEHTRRSGIRKLMVVSTGITGFAPPSLGVRYFLVQEWAKAATGLVRLALVVKPEFIDPEQFGVTVAKNLGAQMRPFLTEAEAIQWLNSTPVDEPPAPPGDK